MRAKPSRLATISIITALIVGFIAANYFPSVARTQPSRYIVQLADSPLASYRGGIDGLAPTNPSARDEVKLDTDSPASLAYLSYLDQQHALVLSAIEQALGHPVEVIYHYKYAYNGMALMLSPEEAQMVAGLSGVRKVSPEFQRYILTDVGPAWIGADTIWSGSSTGGSGTMGEGIVVGVIDTGVNHDHPSFADVGGDGYDHENPRTTEGGLPIFYGACRTNIVLCNDKLIGMWDFTGTTPFDDNGHGSHTASTAAGNVLEAVINAPTTTITRSISGVAPHANLITYKGCLAIGSCVGTSLVAAIDQAVADGVDVLNYSIGGGPTDPWNDADAEAFLNARDAGVFVATSAGNSGPGPETVGSPADAPWVMAVGASTHNRVLNNVLTEMSGGKTAPPADLVGKSLTSGYGPAPIVHAADAGDAQCLNPFPPGTWTNSEIVICDRGTIPRVDKCRNVQTGGAAGCVLANTELEGESTVGDPHVIPAIHIGYADAQILEAWVRDGGEGHTARIRGTQVDVDDAYGDVMAGFSSRGPNKIVPDILKPDVTAPGVDILAAVHTTNPASPPEYATLSGTSMSSPHAAGAAALVRALHPDWTPAQVQSALMTTALRDGVRKEDGLKPADPFDRGAGRIDLSKAGKAGLVLNEIRSNYEAADPEPPEGQAGDPRTLNLPSMADSNCWDICTWKRVVKNVHSSQVRWTATAAGPKNLSLTITPSSFTLEPNESQEVTVTADVRAMPVDKWFFAEVLLEPNVSSIPAAHLPVAVHTKAPLLVEIATGSDTGQHDITIESLVNIQDFSTAIFGLQQGQVVTETLEQDPTNLEPYDTPVGTFYITMEVPLGARFLQTEIVTTTSVDLDLFVGRDADGDGPEVGEELCRSASGTAFESCKLFEPEAGVYWIHVQNWLAGQGLDSVTLQAMVIPGTDNNNMEVTGPVAAPAGEVDVTIAYDEAAMDPGEIWFGMAELSSAPGEEANVATLLVKITRLEDGATPTATPKPTATRIPDDPPPSTPVPTPDPDDPGPDERVHFIPFILISE